MRIGKLKAHAVGLFLSDTSIRRVTALIGPKEVFRLTRRTHRNKAGKRVTNRHSTEGIISLVRPNYLEAAAIKKMVKGGEKFPKLIVKMVA